MNDTRSLPPLDGVRVLDLSRVLAGPYCTALLADAGADVIKVEPIHGDDARHLGPFRDGESLYFDSLNRRKRSIALDLKAPEDLEVLRGLVATVDVLVENFRPGVTARLGIDYERMHELNPRLVYASISGFGQESPMGQAAAYDLIVQALSGVMSLTGTPEGGPTRIGESFGDLVAGLFCSWGITTALLERQRSGLGQHLDVAMFDSMLALEVTAFSQLQATGTAPSRVGNRHPVSTPFDTFRASDGPVVIAVANQRGFVTLLGAIGRPELESDPRFADDTTRTENEPALKAIIEDWTRSRSVAAVVEELSAHGLAAAPIWDVRQAVESEQATARGLRRTFAHPVSGEVHFIEQPVKFSRSPAAPVTRSPLLDEHRDEVVDTLSGTDRPTAAPQQATS
jgi:CoA:oxalate CoA-transferase